MSHAEVLEGPAGTLEVHVYGERPTVVMLASLGRGAEDFTDLASRVADDGFGVLVPQPRGVGRSAGPLDGVTMADLADDVAAIIRALSEGPVAVIGHAFGNRVARMVATTHPDLVESVILLACGGLVPPDPAVNSALLSVFDASLDRDAHLDGIARAFFAPGNDPSVWDGGWYPRTAAAQAGANAGTSVEDWWTAGSADVLVVQPAEDLVAVPANALKIVEMLGDRARMVTIPDAGHALLPEQPALVADEVLRWLHRRRNPGD
ncbi:MAG TPA: alpha/beta hydrolase [Acidimicrobiales bacterium]|nr:alpha/beta hydrolase [Acidimicrobiales bacterium]